MSLATTLHSLAEQLDSALAPDDFDTLTADQTRQLQPLLRELQRQVNTYVSFTEARQYGSNVHPLTPTDTVHATIDTHVRTESAAYTPPSFHQDYAYPMVVGDSFSGIPESSIAEGVRYEWIGSQCIVSRNA